MPFSFRRDSETSPSQKSSQMAPCFLRSMRTPTLRPLSSVTNWIPLMALLSFKWPHRRLDLSPPNFHQHNPNHHQPDTQPNPQPRSPQSHSGYRLLATGYSSKT